MGKRELVALLNLSPWCLVIVEWLFLPVPWGCLQFVVVVFPDHTHYFGIIWRCVSAFKLPRTTGSYIATNFQFAYPFPIFTFMGFLLKVNVYL